MNPLSDRVVSLLRTVVPVAWGSLIAWLLTVISLPAPVSGFLTAQTDAVVVVAISVWYAAFRWLEPKLPAWLTRIVLGSNQTPSYAPVAAVMTLSPTLNPTTAVNGTASVNTVGPPPDAGTANLTFPPGSAGAAAALAQGPPVVTTPDPVPPAVPPAAG